MQKAPCVLPAFALTGELSRHQTRCTHAMACLGLWLRHSSQPAAGAQSLFVLSTSLTPTQLLTMVHILALYCLQLWAGTFGLGLALESDGGVLKQKDGAGLVGPVSFRLNEEGCQCD